MNTICAVNLVGMSWRSAWRLVFALIFCMASAVATAVPAYPSRPIHVIVPFAPGGGVDAAARVFAEQLAKVLGQAVIVENRDGAGGAIGAQYVARAAPDGYTLLFGGSATHGIRPSVQKNMGYDAVKDFTPVIALVREPLVMVVNPAVPAQSVADFVTYAKQHPGDLSYASAGPGTLIHLSGEMLDAMAGISMRHVPYRGLAPGLLDVLADRVQVTWAPYNAVADQVRTGRLRALGVTTAEPSAFVPGLAPIASVVPGYDATGWYGILLPAHTPRTIVDRLNQAIRSMLGDKEFAAKLARLDLEPIGGTPEDFANFIHGELQKWGRVARDAKVGAN